MKTKHKPRAKLSRTPVKALRNRRRVVKTLAAQGFSGDVIAAKLQLNKNHLRAEHALDLLAGREIKQRKQQLKPLSYRAKNVRSSRSLPPPGIPIGTMPSSASACCFLMQNS